MPAFTFKAQKQSGEVYSETMEAADKLQLYKELRRRGDSLISVSKDSSVGGGFLSRLKVKDITLFSSVKEIEKINFARHLSSMLEAGLPMSRALSVLERQAKKKEMKNILSSVQEKIKEGGTLSTGLEHFPKVFPKIFVAMVKAGEESGDLEGNLRAIADQMEKNYNLKRQIRGAMIYPIVVLFIMVAIGVLMLTYIVPTLVGVFEDMDAELPIQTRMVIFASDMLVHNALLVSLGTLAFVVFAFFFLRSDTGGRFVDVCIIRTPFIKTIVREVNAARTARTMSSLLAAGVDVVPTLSITEGIIQNSYYKPILREAQDRIQKGEQISKVFVENQDLFPVFMGEMMSVGEETGKVSEMLQGVADFFESEVDQRTKNISTIIEPVLMVIIGIGVGFFAVSMLMPMYSLLEHI
ncbi:MAG: type II secretion system F family protein [Candidatus Paceibacterota bacterium]